jgi:cell division protein FtsI/penicillin-binding protein 2
VDNGAVSGTIIVSDPETGEILAMATNPRINPNEYAQYSDMLSQDYSYNRAIDINYEPGSVFKVFPLAAAIDTGVVERDTVFLDQGFYQVGGFTIYNWDRSAWGPQTIIGCMQHSLNVCLSWLAVEKLGSTRFYEYLDRFGIGHRTNIDLAGERVYPVSIPGDSSWSDVNLATNSFGQGLAVTPIQIVTAINAIANDGKIMAPHIVKAVLSAENQITFQPRIVATPISADTAYEVTDILAISLEQEASSALVEGYRVAGKTGTAEIAIEGEGYSTELTNASFVGWGPTDDPKFLVYIWLEKPTSSKWGSIVAAPIFSKVVRELVILMDIPPDDVRQQLASQ